MTPDERRYVHETMRDAMQTVDYAVLQALELLHDPRNADEAAALLRGLRLEVRDVVRAADQHAWEATVDAAVSADVQPLFLGASGHTRQNARTGGPPPGRV